MQRDFEWKYQETLSKKDVTFHDAMKPYLHSDFKKSTDTVADYAMGFPFRKINNSKPGNKSRLMLMPLVDASILSESGDTSAMYSHLGIGAGALFEYADVFSAQLNFSGHRQQFPSFLNEQVESLRKVPQGMAWHDQNGGYNYLDLNGYVSWNATDYLNFQVGRGNQFLGSGYRSLFLSENAGNYNFGKLTVDIWRIKYSVIYTHQKDMNSTMSTKSKDFRDKFNTMHYISWNVTKWLNLGFFESVVWKASDTLLDRGYDVNYLNPVIFFRPVEYSTGSSDNSLLGMSMSIKPTDGCQIYGQFILDEFLLAEFSKDMKELVNPGSQTQTGWWANKYGWQLGTKAFNLFGIDNLGIQAEFNLVRPFTYSHQDPVQNFGHQNGGLAHPLGANFMESSNFLNYRKNNWFFEGKVSYAYQGLSTDSLDMGEDIFSSYSNRQSDYGNVTGQGIQSHVLVMGLRSSYLVFPESNLRFNAGASYRMGRLAGVSSTGIYFQMGISTSFKNSFFDN